MKAERTTLFILVVVGSVGAMIYTGDIVQGIVVCALVAWLVWIMQEIIASGVAKGITRAREKTRRARAGRNYRAPLVAGALSDFELGPVRRGHWAGPRVVDAGEESMAEKQSRNNKDATLPRKTLSRKFNLSRHTDN